MTIPEACAGMIRLNVPNNVFPQDERVVYIHARHILSIDEEKSSRTWPHTQYTITMANGEIYYQRIDGTQFEKEPKCPPGD